MSRLFLGEKMDDIDNFSEQLKSLHEQLKNKFISFIEKSGLVVEEKYKESIVFNKIKDVFFRMHNKDVKFHYMAVVLSMDTVFAYKIFNIKKELPNTHVQYIAITINNELDIAEIQIMFTFGNHSYIIRSLTIVLDENLKINYLSYNNVLTGTYTKTENMMPVDDEIFLCRFLYIIEQSIINQIIPEIRMVGVYDYNSDDFQKRIEYCELLDY